MKHEKTFLKAVMAGAYIGIAGLIYLSIENQVIGSLFFSFGLLVILARGYYLYTGKVGYLYPYQKGFFIMLLKTIAGNAVGITLVSYLYQFTGVTSLVDRASLLFENKLDHLWYETLILAIFCGMMMYIAVDSYQKVKMEGLKILLVIMSISIFILAKFEHSIANMLYLTLGNTYTLKSLFYLTLMIIGNGIGSVLLNFIDIKLKTNQS